MPGPAEAVRLSELHHSADPPHLTGMPLPAGGAGGPAGPAGGGGYAYPVAHQERCVIIAVLPQRLGVAAARGKPFTVW